MRYSSAPQIDFHFVQHPESIFALHIGNRSNIPRERVHPPLESPATRVPLENNFYAGRILAVLVTFTTRQHKGRLFSKNLCFVHYLYSRPTIAPGSRGEIRRRDAPSASVNILLQRARSLSDTAVIWCLPATARNNERK